MEIGQKRPRFALVFVAIVLVVLFGMALADDGAAMAKLLGSLKVAPDGWSSSVDSCNWSGVKCDRSNRVVSIDVGGMGVVGTLPPELSSLSQLQTLRLQKNSLSGELPSLANLTALEEILLDSNNFTSVPKGCFGGLTSLQTLSIAQNGNLAPWPFPEELTQSSSLQELDAASANLVGSIPDIFDSFQQLQSLRLSYNNLTGPLPKSLGSSQIQNLWLNNQDVGLSGTLDVLSGMIMAYQVWLHKNQFTGPIPDLSKCVNLFDLNLRDNLLTGVVPSSLQTLPNIQNVSLANNKLQGPVPAFGKGVQVTLGTSNKFCLPDPGPCDPQVTTLLAVSGAMGYPMTLADSWDGNNACNGWSFVTCDSGKNNVITVNFAKKGFSGTISPAYSNLTSLRNLYLNDNNLTGSIPESLTKLASLQILDVSNNNLSGPIPKFGSSVKLVTTGNGFLGKNISTGGGGSGGNGTTPSGGSSAPSSGGKVSPAMIAGVVVAAVLFLLVVSFVIYKCRTRKQHRKLSKANLESGSDVKPGSVNGTNGYGPSELPSQNSSEWNNELHVSGGSVQISIQVLRQVTNNFSDDNILGQGGFGVVYRGELHDGTKIAVKRMEYVQMRNKGMNEFQAEIGVLTKVRHRHLVALLGYCINGNERLLVYEYMPKGNLTEHLFDWRNRGYSPLTWKQRVTIALDVARGVEYLHGLAQQSFIHRDLKPSNILLGDDMRAKVADFGLVKNAPDGKYSVETRLAGTFGYLAPEYAATGRVTTKVDVYAFGVILMEVITGRKALDENMPDESSHLVTWFRRVLVNKDNIAKAVDQTLHPLDEETLDSIGRVAELAGHCTAREPYQRPDMGHAVNILSPLVEQWKPASQEEEDNYGIDFHMSLPQALQRWQANEGTSTMYDVSHSQTQDSIPPQPSVFGDSFDTMDCR